MLFFITLLLKKSHRVQKKSLDISAHSMHFFSFMTIYIVDSHGSIKAMNEHVWCYIPNKKKR